MAEGHYVLRPLVTSPLLCLHIIWIPFITDLCLFETILYMVKNKICLEAYRPKGRRNIGRPKKRWRDQLHFEDQGTGNTPNPSGT